MNQRYYVRTFGCQMNEHDSERIAGMLAASGLDAASSVEEADVVVLNTCCIRENADNKLYGNLGHLASKKRENPDLRIVVAGCLAQKDRDQLAERAPYVDVVVGTFNLSRIPSLLSEADGEHPVVEIWERSEEGSDPFAGALAAKRESEYLAWVTIQTGCNNRCAFCIVPSVRGVEASRSFSEIVSEVRALARQGVREVTLLGQNVNSYGRDLTLAARSGQLGESIVEAVSPQWLMDSSRRARPLFGDLLREVGAVEGISRVRFTSPHPKDMREETFLAMAETPAVCEQLHFPLQSGSDRILSRMHRGYTAERYLDRLALAREIVPDLAVTTDIIVGFPGETEEDFERTLEVASAASYDGAFTFIFSPRPGTEAADMEASFVDPDVVADRFERLKIVIERSALQRHEARVGRTEEVLLEGPSKRDAEVWSGRTRQNKLVHIAPPSDGTTFAAGRLVQAEIVSAAPHFLRAVYRSSEDPMPRRRRIVVHSA